MTVTEITSKHGKAGDDLDGTPSLTPAAGSPRRSRIIPFLITMATVMLAGALGWAMWGVYMRAPWTRDATVRAYVVTMAPEVAGRIVELNARDNAFVHKGDLLMVIDPTDYKISVAQNEAAVQQAEASVQSIDAQITVQGAQIASNQAQLDGARAGLVFAQQQDTRFQALAKDGWNSVQNAQQSTSQLRQQEAAVHGAEQKSQSGAAATRGVEGPAAERRGNARASQGAA